MLNYYSILGISATANEHEIKKAYRELAKKLHPDLNNNSEESEEKFKLIKQAYETLSDKNKKFIFDQKLAAHSEKNSRFGASSNTNITTSKRRRERPYNFSEEELKRRRYYQEMYGNKNKKDKPQPKVVPTKKESAFREFHFILISIPLSVALLFLIVNQFPTKNNSNVIKKVNEKEISDSMQLVKTSDSPLYAFFGDPGIDRFTKFVFTVTNTSGNDAVVCVSDIKTNKTLRHYFIENNYNLLFEYLPEGDYYLKYGLLPVSYKFKNDTSKMENNFLAFFADTNTKINVRKEKVDSVTVNLKTGTETEISKAFFLDGK